MIPQGCRSGSRHGRRGGRFRRRRRRRRYRPQSRPQRRLRGFHRRRRRRPRRIPLRRHLERVRALHGDGALEMLGDDAGVGQYPFADQFVGRRGARRDKRRGGNHMGHCCVSHGRIPRDPLRRDGSRKRRPVPGVRRRAAAMGGYSGSRTSTTPSPLSARLAKPISSVIFSMAVFSCSTWPTTARVPRSRRYPMIFSISLNPSP